VTTRKTTTKSSKPDEVKITAAKGRPMLTWVGKKPLTRVTAFPAQHIETFDPANDAASRTGPEWAEWPASYPRGGLLFHGDNKEVLAHLLANGFRGKVDLIYIDPPFDSGADYVRRVSLRGTKGAAKLDGETYTLGEQIQYEDIWANDNYLQFMFERLLLLWNLLADGGSLWLHLDWHRHAQLKLVLDEICGAEAFTNEVVWWYFNKLQGNVNRFASNHDTLLLYRKGESTFNPVSEERPEVVRQLKRVWDPVKGSLVNARGEDGSLVYVETTERLMDDVWRIIALQPADPERLDFPTQKPEDLLSAIVGSTSKPGDLVMDAFVGSGTTSVVSQKLGRRWIGCDINKGALHTTARRLQGVIESQLANGQETMLEDGAPPPAQLSFTTWRVNDYDLQIQHNEAVNLACEHIGVLRSKTDRFFDGTLGKALVKIAPFTHPLSPADLDDIRDELDARPDEDRSVTVVCLGIELAAQAWLEDWNRLRRGRNSANRVEAIELRTDERYGAFLSHDPAQAKVTIERANGLLHVRIDDFISPTIVKRLAEQTGVVEPRIDDWRAMVDCVMIDASYDGKVFDIALSDVPERKTDLVRGEYELPASKGKTTVAVKIVDMLGEEVLETAHV
jgi:DNA modification methylase